MKYAHVVSYVVNTPWAILPEKLAVIMGALAYLARGGEYTPEEVAAIVGAARRAEPAQAGAIAVLPFVGTVYHRAEMMMQTSGGVSTERFARLFRQALADPAVGAIVIDVDSPGGSVEGVDELSAEIYRARGSKPIVAVANSMAASAAYYVATAADELVASPSSEVGAIGVWAAHEDLSKAMELDGVKISLISAGKYKVEGNPYEPLSEEARAAIQARVDTSYEMFLAAVARNRGVGVEAVRGGFGEGRLVAAKRAKALGMVDEVATLEETIERVARRLTRRPPGPAAALDEVSPPVRAEPLGHRPPAPSPSRPAGRSGEGEERPGSETRPTGFAMGLTVTNELVVAGPIPAHKSPAIADEDAEWDAAAEVAKAEGSEQLRRMHAWVDDEGDPEAKSSYKLPHHRADGTLVPRGLYAAAQRLEQTEMPAEDRPGTRAHLDGHYDELGKKPPWKQGASLDVRRRRLRLVER